MTKIAFIWFFSLIPSVLFAAPLFNSTLVGNGGEGILDGNRVYTRDLFELSLHQSAHFGPQSDPQIRAKIQIWNPLKLSLAQRELLVRKLTDIKKAYPPLAYGLIDALRYHNWKYTDLPLVLLEDEGRMHIPQGRRISIANRYLSSILIQRTEFEKLDDANKIALLLHEAIYAFVSTQKVENAPGLESQSSALTRQITANLFSEDLSSENLRPWLSFLSFGDLKSNAKPCLDVQLTVQALFMGRLNDGILAQSISRPFIPAVSEYYPLTNLIYDEIEKAVCKSSLSYIVAKLDEAFVTVPRFYQGPQGPQIRLMVRSVPQLVMSRSSTDICNGGASVKQSFVIDFNKQTEAHRTLCVKR